MFMRFTHVSHCANRDAVLHFGLAEPREQEVAVWMLLR